MPNLPGIHPSRSSLHLCARVVGAVVLLLAAQPAAAQKPDEDANDKTWRIATTYRLTEPVLKKYMAAMRELRDLARKDPSVIADRDSSEGLHPAARAIFVRAGLTEDEMEKFMIAMGWAQMATLGASVSGEAAGEVEKAPVLRANIAFLKAHEAELKAIEADMNAMKSGGGEEERAGALKVTGAMRAGVNSEIELEVTGGRHAGRYTAKVSEGGCSYGMTKSGAWGNQYSIDTKDATKFSSLQLIVSDAEAAAGGTEDFMLMVSFGPLLSGTHYTVEPGGGRRAEGRGTLKIDDSGAGATLTFDATTKDGVGLKGTIKCYTVMRMTSGR